MMDLFFRMKPYCRNIGYTEFRLKKGDGSIDLKNMRIFSGKLTGESRSNSDYKIDKWIKSQ